MRELVSKLAGGRMCARFHLASRAKPRAAEIYRMVGQAQVQISTVLDSFFVGILTGGFDGSWTCFQRGVDRFLEASSAGF